jgi:6,7-dimethyl-8-ribityllumazine synthase
LPQGGFSSEEDLDASGLRFAIVVARFNAHVTGKLYDGCYDVLVEKGAATKDIERIDVPGCFELPVVAKELGVSRRFDAVIALGAVIRGDTPHFEYVSSATALGLQQAALDSGTPVIFGVLTTDNEEQAAVRVAGEGHKGREAALTAIDIARTLKRVRQG